MIEVQQSAESFLFGHLAFVRRQFLIWKRNEIAESLMVSLFVVVIAVLLENVVKRFFTEQDQLVENFGFYGTNLAFCEGIQVGRLSEPSEIYLRLVLNV